MGPSHSAGTLHDRLAELYVGKPTYEKENK